MSNDVLPPALSLRDLVNQLNRPPAPDQPPLSGIAIEQDWVEAIRHAHQGDVNLRIKAMATLIEEIGRLKKQLTASEQRRTELESLIDADALCPALNRRAFERELFRAIAWAKRSGRNGSVLYLDLNGLKGLNDTHGHVAGDKAIERLAKMLVLSCRSTDIIGRLGGDEFAVIMPDTPPSGALVRAERVADLLARVPLIVGNATLFLSTAYGAADYTGDEQPREVLDKADEAMYAHKQKMKDDMC